jgi:hypothetical protein
MPIKTNMTSLQPRRQAYKREITLLSKGFSAPKAWPGGKITVYPWDSEVDAYVLEQAKANSQDNLLYGMLERVIDMNGASIDQFVFSEINSILLVSRSIQFDGTIEYQSSCPYCHAKDHELIKIPHELAPIGEKALDYPGFDEITLPDCKDVVRIRPLLVKDQKKIEMRDSDALLKFSDRKLQILFSIVTVNEGAPDTVDEAAEWYDALSPTDSRHLEERQVDLSPRLDNRLPHKCKKCTRDFHHTLLFDQEFFRPGGQGQPAPAPEKDVRTGVGREQGVRGRPTPPQRR